MKARASQTDENNLEISVNGGGDLRLIKNSTTPRRTKKTASLSGLCITLEPEEETTGKLTWKSYQ